MLHNIRSSRSRTTLGCLVSFTQPQPPYLGGFLFKEDKNTMARTRRMINGVICKRTGDNPTQGYHKYQCKCGVIGTQAELKNKHECDFTKIAKHPWLKTAKATP